MDSLLSHQIKCAICLQDFQNPVILPCDHTFCLQCATDHIHAHPGLCLCPECEHPFQKKDLRDCQLLGDITCAAKNTLQKVEAAGAMVEEIVCAEHQEKLKLFCMTDGKLVCSICRDSDRHQRHEFKPVTEAAAIYEVELKACLGYVHTEKNELCDLERKRRNKIKKIKDKSKRQHDQITAQFAMMYEFLRQRERAAREQVDGQERSVLEPMLRSEDAIAGRLRETEMLEESLGSGLEMANPSAFLQWWSDKGLHQVQEMKNESNETKRRICTLLSSRTADLKDLSNRFTIGPYESYSPIFIWREMFKHLTQALEVFVKVSPTLNLSLCHNGGQQANGRAVFSRRKKLDSGYWLDLMESLQSGQHYWEVEVGQEGNWQLGLRVQVHPQRRATSTLEALVLALKQREVALLLKNYSVFMVRETGEEVRVDLPDRPRRIGVYLDCDRRQVVFCNADTRSVIYTDWCRS